MSRPMSRPMPDPAASPGPMRDAAMLAEQRRRARRTAIVLGIVALCLYLGFILATGLL